MSTAEPRNAMQRVLQDRRQVTVACPGCAQIVGLWLRLLPVPEYHAMYALTDLTASLLPPERRGEAMRQAADMDAKTAVVPWVTCVRCGYDGHYVIGAATDTEGR